MNNLDSESDSDMDMEERETTEDYLLALNHEQRELRNQQMQVISECKNLQERFAGKNRLEEKMKIEAGRSVMEMGFSAERPERMIMMDESYNDEVDEEMEEG